MLCMYISLSSNSRDIREHPKIRKKRTNGQNHKATNGQTQKIEVKTVGPIVFVFLCFVFYLSLAVQLQQMLSNDVIITSRYYLDQLQHIFK